MSAEDDQNVRHRVFCKRLLPGGRRCLLRAEGTCAEQRRPLVDQVAAYLSLTRQLVPPQPGALPGSAPGPAPPATRTTAGPPTDR
ncbi:hypothetical protein DLE60_15885 [Micromonospora globispora]|nr:hypothetical protein DLE60_15885 [Micromonospora globispora]